MERQAVLTEWMEERRSAGPSGAKPDQDRNNNKWSGMGLIHLSREKKRMGKSWRKSWKAKERRTSGRMVSLSLYSSNGMALGC